MNWPGLSSLEARFDSVARYYPRPVTELYRWGHIAPRMSRLIRFQLSGPIAAAVLLGFLCHVLRARRRCPGWSLAVIAAVGGGLALEHFAVLKNPDLGQCTHGDPPGFIFLIFGFVFFLLYRHRFVSASCRIVSIAMSAGRKWTLTRRSGPRGGPLRVHRNSFGLVDIRRPLC